jgi:hypothetical protein
MNSIGELPNTGELLDPLLPSINNAILLNKDTDESLIPPSNNIGVKANRKCGNPNSLHKIHRYPTAAAIVNIYTNWKKLKMFPLLSKKQKATVKIQAYSP